jgi:hypothetical protein
MNCEECNTEFNYEDFLYNSSNNCKKCIVKNYKNMLSYIENYMKCNS